MGPATDPDPLSGELPGVHVGLRAYDETACGCGHVYSCPCGCRSCPRCDTAPAGGSLVAGSIGRGLADAATAYRDRLSSLLHASELGPWND